MLRTTYMTFISLFSLIFVTAAYADSISFSSGTQKVHLLELYSSQGCSSCPPAQNWVNQLEDSDLLWKRVVPVVFHVDYWDYLGWKDPFSKSQFSYRQRAHKRQNNINSVYTPGFVVNGKEWRGWFKRQPLDFTDASSGQLNVEIADEKFNAVYLSGKEQTQTDIVLNIALLGMNNITNVLAGENRSRKLEESFIVLELTRYSGVREDNSKGVKFEGELPHNKLKTAVAVWITTQSSLQPIQVTGGYL